MKEIPPVKISLNRREVDEYDTVIVYFSGGKDSLACLLHLFDLGIDRRKIELWHHLIDGREGSVLMDWPVTESYCERLAQALRVPIFYSWRRGGFEREFLKENALSGPIMFEVVGEDNESVDVVECAFQGGPGTRLKFPQLGDMTTRWCTSYMKIDVATRAINDQERFVGQKVLVISGERFEESSARQGYKDFEPDRADSREGIKFPKVVDRWRPVHKWDEAKVWEIIRKYGVVPHPAYRLGWGRLSCAACIYGRADQWASLKVVNPAQFKAVADYERMSEITISRSKMNVDEMAAKGAPYASITDELVRKALSSEFRDPVIVPASAWEMPAGAFGDSTGPS